MKYLEKIFYYKFEKTEQKLKKKQSIKLFILEENAILKNNKINATEFFKYCKKHFQKTWGVYKKLRMR